MNLKLYRQTTIFTCGPSCILMILNLYKNLSLTKLNEILIWKETMAIPFRINLPLTMANYLIDQGIFVTIVSEDLKIKNCNIMFEYEGISKNMSQYYLDIFDFYYNQYHYNRFLRRGKWIKEKPNISKYLDSLCLLLIDTGPIIDFLRIKDIRAPDWAIFYNDTFYSPWYGKLKIPLEIIQRAIDCVRYSYKFPPTILVITKEKI